jgi:hypothetical protein
MLLSTKKVRCRVAFDAKGNVYVADIVTDGTSFLLQAFRTSTVTKRVAVSLTKPRLRLSA